MPKVQLAISLAQRVRVLLPEELGHIRVCGELVAQRLLADLAEGELPSEIAHLAVLVRLIPSVAAVVVFVDADAVFADEAAPAHLLRIRLRRHVHIFARIAVAGKILVREYAYCVAELVEQHLKRLVVSRDNADFAARTAVYLGVHHDNRVVRCRQFLAVNATHPLHVLFGNLDQALHARSPEGCAEGAVARIRIRLRLGSRMVRAHTALIRAHTDRVNFHRIGILVPRGRSHHVLCHALCLGKEKFLFTLCKSIAKKGENQRVLIVQLRLPVNQTRFSVQNCLLSLIHIMPPFGG